MNIEKTTVGQHKKKTRHTMRHLLVTGKKLNHCILDKKLKEKNPLTDVHSL